MSRMHLDSVNIRKAKPCTTWHFTKLNIRSLNSELNFKSQSTAGLMNVSRLTAHLYSKCVSTTRPHWLSDTQLKSDTRLNLSVFRLPLPLFLCPFLLSVLFLCFPPRLSVRPSTEQKPNPSGVTCALPWFCFAVLVYCITLLPPCASVSTALRLRKRRIAFSSPVFLGLFNKPV